MNSEPQILELPSPASREDEPPQVPGQNGATTDFSDRDDPASIQHPQSDTQDPESSGNPPIQQSTPSSHPAVGEYRGNGKVARLPKSVRDQINNWMLDGVSYPDI